MKLTGDRIDISVSPDTLSLIPGGHAEVTLRLTNQGPTVDEFEIAADGVDQAWIKLRTPSVRLLPQANGALVFDVEIPADLDVVATTYPLRLRVLSHDDSRSETLINLPLEVAAVGGVELSMVPQMVTTRGTGQFRIQLRNPSNAARVIDLVVMDPDNALEHKLAIDRMALDPLEAREVRLSVRPRHRPFVAQPHTYSFTIHVLAAGTDAEHLGPPLAGASGTLVYQAPLAFLAPIPLLARGLIAALVALLVLLAVAAWLIGGAGLPSVFKPSLEPTVAPTALPSAPPASTPPDAPLIAVPPEPPIVPPLPPPAITMYQLSVPSDAGPGEFELTWQVDGAESVTLAGQPEPDSGTVRMKQPDGGQFELLATNQGGTVRKSIGVVVLRPPEIQVFAASPTQVPAGGTVTLSWTLKRADRAAIDGKVVAFDQGKLQVQPNGDTTYTLVAENELGPTRQSVSVKVSPTATSGQ